jgi:molybdenum cofactor cytidylyltransferase
MVTRKHGRSGISALVLAAGTSQRMGRPKQLLRFGDSPLLEHALASARQADVDEVILVLGFAADEIQRTIGTNGLVIAINQEYQQGMGTSLRTAISAISPQAQGALVILADQPFVRLATLNSLIEYHARHRPQIIIPTYQGFRGNPVLLDRSVFPELMSLKGDVGCRAIFGRHTENIHKLSVQDAGVLLDVDTLEDFHKLRSLLQEGAAALLPAADLEEAHKPSSQPELVIVGRDAVAAALARLARVLHFTTTVVDPFLRLADFPDADRILHRLDFSLLPNNNDRYFVVASRGQFDEEAMEQALAANAGYIALMASKSRREELMGTLKKKGLQQESLNRLHAPAGLEIGAETPEEIALSILAEIVSERKKPTAPERP